MNANRNLISRTFGERTLVTTWRSICTFYYATASCAQYTAFGRRKKAPRERTNYIFGKLTAAATSVFFAILTTVRTCCSHITIGFIAKHDGAPPPRQYYILPTSITLQRYERNILLSSPSCDDDTT